MSFHDVASPTAPLTPPHKPAGFVDPLHAVNAVGDVLSPTGWLVKLAELVLGEDPVEWLEAHLAGDWESFARCAETWHNLARATDALARNIGSGTAGSESVWEGNAADAARTYFTVLRTHLEGIRDELHAVGEEYLVISRSVCATGQAVGEGLSLLMDALITGALAAAVGTVSGWTGWGAAMGYALGAAEARVALKEWERITALVNAAQVVMNTSCAVIGRSGGEIAARLGTFPLPRTGYDHPAV
ncbi:hypothetical protein [Streptomyces sp. NPDC049585]|uniref:hypothetical protein n=1 Tax=Streptomyces sp. NPDC049585 TaxID=3155154 RepID=UPI00341B999C